MIIISGDDSYNKALKKAEDPNMILDSNPLYSERKDNTVDRNMQRLRNDARLRGGVHGSVYSGIMATRFQGGK